MITARSSWTNANATMTDDEIGEHDPARQRPRGEWRIAAKVRKIFVFQ